MQMVIVKEELWPFSMFVCAWMDEWVSRTPPPSASCYLVARQLSHAALMDGLSMDGPHYFPRAVKEKESWQSQCVYSVGETPPI